MVFEVPTRGERITLSQTEILEKLNVFLQSHVPFSEECHAVYFLVEIRKLLHHEQLEDKYPILQFYCDWSVHTDKDFTNAIKSTIVDIYEDVVSRIKTGDAHSGRPKIIGFIYMEDLQADVASFLVEHGLGSSLVDTDNWLALVTVLVKVLVDQPINNPSTGVRSLAFLPAADGCVRGEMVFTHPVEGRNVYEFGDAYYA